MTEDEAKTKICHVTLNPVAIAAVSNSMGAMDMRIEAQPCIGSACMAWEWQDGLLPKPNSLSQGNCGLKRKP